MALRNAFGGLALDETIKQLIEKMRNWQDPEWVTSHPDMPVHVAGKLNAVVDDPYITGKATFITSTTASQVFAQPNPLRTGLAILNTSASATLFILAAANTTLATTYTLQILAGQYWELPQSPRGCYKGLITGLWSVADLGATVTEWTGS